MVPILGAISYQKWVPKSCPVGELLVPKMGTKSPPTGPKTGTTFGYQKVGPLLTFDKGPNFWYPKWVPKVGPLDPLLVPKNGYQKFAHWAQIWYPFWHQMAPKMGTRNQPMGLVFGHPMAGYLPPRMENSKLKSIALRRRAYPRCKHHL